jgi:two-component system, NarL family, nitrate/nitrite response regulator NarL
VTSPAGIAFRDLRRTWAAFGLTPREEQVLQMTAEGLSAPDIAKRLVVSRGTVKTHFQNIYDKLEVRDRAAAVARVLRLGFID